MEDFISWWILCVNLGPAFLLYFILFTRINARVLQFWLEFSHRIDLFKYIYIRLTHMIHLCFRLIRAEYNGTLLTLYQWVDWTIVDWLVVFIFVLWTKANELWHGWRWMNIGLGARWSCSGHQRTPVRGNPSWNLQYPGNVITQGTASEGGVGFE